jgi:DNA-binding response OmpR family regulator
MHEFASIYSTPDPHPGTLILLVEDDPGVAQFMSDVLRETGYVSRLCRNGLEFADYMAQVARGEAARPDLVLLDLIMPGLDPLSEYRNLDPSDRPPVIVCSARPQGQVETAADYIHADALITKPFEANDLLTRIVRVLYG